MYIIINKPNQMNPIIIKTPIMINDGQFEEGRDMLHS